MRFNFEKQKNKNKLDCHLIIKKNLSIGIKWPNDVYYDKKTKIGGILARSSFMGDQIFAKIG